MWITNFFLNSKPNRQYIIPTLDGLKLFSVNMILLILGLIYANNYVLLFNFLLFCLFLSSMFYTHFNLQDIKMVSITQNEIFANSPGSLSIFLKAEKNPNRYGVSAKTYVDKKYHISNPQNLSVLENYINIDINIKKRGIYPINRIMLQTLFPLHLFNSFMYLKTDFNLIIYPEIKSKVDLNVMNEIFQDGEDDNLKIRNYVIGDNIKRILWKKSTSDRLFIREFEQNFEEGISFDLNLIPLEKIEDTISSIATILVECNMRKIPFGLILKNQTIPANSYSKSQLKRCLQELALYEV